MTREWSIRILAKHPKLGDIKIQTFGVDPLPQVGSTFWIAPDNNAVGVKRFEVRVVRALEVVFFNPASVYGERTWEINVVPVDRIESKREEPQAKRKK